MTRVDRIRVVIADTSHAARAVLTSALEQDDELEVVAEAVDGVHAVDLARMFRPAVVVMNSELPRIDGFEATRRIMAEHPTRVIVLTGDNDTLPMGAELRAMRAGALTVTAKPLAVPGTRDYGEQARRLLTLVKALADVKIVRHRSPLRPPTAAEIPRDEAVLEWRGLQAVGVAASTGGPAAVFRFLQQLPPTLAIPVLVVQHIAPGFIDDMASWLAGATKVAVKVAGDGEPLRAGHVYMAPDDRHLVVRDGLIHLESGPRNGGFRPSANVLFSSLAESYGPKAAAVTLSGMGHDGVDGAKALRAAGGLVLAQDDTSVIFGMPRAVATAGLAHFIGPVEDLADQIVRSAVRGAVMA